MRRIDEAGERFGRTIDRGGREQSQRLVSPGAAERVLGYRQQLDMDKYVLGVRLSKFWEAWDSSLRPMTSLRDVDQGGVIRESSEDAFSRRADKGATARVMKFIRRGSGADIDVNDPYTESFH